MIKRFDNVDIKDVAITGDNAYTMMSHMSGARGGMTDNHRRQGVPPVHAEQPIMSFGHENLFARHSTLGLVKAKSDSELYRVIKKNDNFTIYLFRDVHTGHISMEERGYFMNIGPHFAMKCADNLESMPVGTKVKKGDVLVRASSFDEYLNYGNGVNAQVAFLNTVETYEDSIMISESFAEKMAHYQIIKYAMTLSKGEVFLSTSNDPRYHKCFPDIMETIDGVLIAAKRRRNSISSFIDSLNENIHIDNRQPNDDVITGHKGSTVVDIDVFVNSDPEELRAQKHNEQIMHYYDKNMAFYKEFVGAIDEIIATRGEKCLDPEVVSRYVMYRKFIEDCKKTPGRGGKEFDNVYIEISCLVKYKGITGSKLTGRLAEKGVTGFIRPDKDMPVNEYGIVADIAINNVSTFKRLIPGQLYESDVSEVGRWVVRKAVEQKKSRAEIIKDIITFIGRVSHMDLDYEWNTLSKASQADFDDYINFCMTWGPNLVIKPIKNKFNSDFIYKMYNEWYPDYEPPKVYWYGKELIERPLIAPKYILVLEHTPDTKTSGRASGFCNPVTGPVRKKTHEILKNSSLKCGYMENDALEILNSLNDPTNAAVEFKYANGSSRWCRESIIEQLLTKEPKDVYLDPEDIEKHPQESVLALEAYMGAVGTCIKTVTVGEAEQISDNIINYNGPAEEG
jgi:DNA-directed RNA polymerase beta subunit